MWLVLLDLDLDAFAHPALIPSLRTPSRRAPFHVKFHCRTFPSTHRTHHHFPSGTAAASHSALCYHFRQGQESGTPSLTPILDTIVHLRALIYRGARSNYQLQSPFLVKSCVPAHLHGLSVSPQ
ncbi:hypothetical protein B0O80DRAFT_118663 [Mortierella sp. GBAus27b]|nr:hypothetical protein B0O80DRAFT_118663 [Mortierella sp. GBAus27b]